MLYGCLACCWAVLVVLVVLFLPKILLMYQMGEREKGETYESSWLQNEVEENLGSNHMSNCSHFQHHHMQGGNGWGKRGGTVGETKDKKQQKRKKKRLQKGVIREGEGRENS